MSNIVFKKEEIEKIKEKIEAKSNEIRELLDDIEMMGEGLDGTDETWMGKGQESFYNSYKSIAKKFPTINEKLDENISFINNSLDSYVDADNTIDSKIDKE